MKVLIAMDKYKGSLTAVQAAAEEAGISRQFVAIAMAEVQDALARLKRETARRVQSPLRSDFQIARGWLNPLAT